MPMPSDAWDLNEALGKIETAVMEDDYHEGDIVVLEIDDNITLEEELEMYVTAVKTLHLRGCGFVKVKMKRKAEA